MIYTLAPITNILICIVVLLFAKYLIENRNYYRNALGFPSFSPIIPSFLFGWLTVPLSKFDLYPFLLRYQNVTEEFSSFWLPGFLVVPRKVEQLEIIFESPNFLNKSVHYDTLSIIFGETGLISTSAETFRSPKKVLMKCFVGSSQKIFIDNFYRAAELLSNTLEVNMKDAGAGGWVKIHKIIREVTTRSICWSGFDMDPTETIWNGLQNLEEYMVTVILSGTLRHNSWPFKWSPFSRTIKEAETKAKAAVNEIKTIKRKDVREMLSRNEEPPNQFIYNLLRERVDDSEDLIDADIITVFVTALETSGGAICLTLTMLAMHPDIQEKVYEEDRRIQQELKGSKMAERDFNRYEYLGRVVKETLRIFSPVPYIARKAAADVPIGKYTVPNDSTVAIVMSYIHRSPEYYPDPLKFDPDRFLPENVAKRSKYAHIPFSMGLRQCTGMQYATRSILFMVSSVIRKFKISTKYKSIEELDANITGLMVIYDKDEFPIRLELRSAQI